MKKMSLREISVYDYKGICNNNLSHVLVDVREHWEGNKAKLPGSRQVPLAVLESELKEWDPAALYIIYCHHGMRSLQGCQIMIDNGFDQVFNLKGGIDAWSTQIDPSVPCY